LDSGRGGSRTVEQAENKVLCIICRKVPPGRFASLPVSSILASEPSLWVDGSAKPMRTNSGGVHSPLASIILWWLWSGTQTFTVVSHPINIRSAQIRSPRPRPVALVLSIFSALSLSLRHLSSNNHSPKAEKNKEDAQLASDSVSHT